MTSLRDRLGFLSDTDFTMQMLRGELHIPPDVDATTTLVLEEIVRLFGTLEDGHTEITLGILNDISSGIDEAAALMKRGRNMIWLGMTSAADVIISGVVDDGVALSGDNDEYYHEGDGEGGGPMTMTGRMNSGGDIENDTFDEDEFTDDGSEAEGTEEEEEEEEVLFLDVSRSSGGQDHSLPHPQRKHAGFKLKSLDMVTMRRKLMQAEEQRNMLMQTVESRYEEILKLRQTIEQQPRRRQRDCEVRHLEGEVEWWEHFTRVCSKMTSTSTDDKCIDELKSILYQFRSRGDIDDHNGGGSIKDSIKAAKERIRELKSCIQATKNRTIHTPLLN
jgi:hypothetical protein